MFNRILLRFLVVIGWMFMFASKSWSIDWSSLDPWRGGRGGYGQGGGGSNSGYDSSENRKFRQIQQLMNAAYAAANDRQDYREALRLAHEAQGLSDSKEIRDWIVKIEAQVLKKDGEAAEKAGDRKGALAYYRRALGKWSDVLSAKDKKYVDELERTVISNETAGKRREREERLQERNRPEAMSLNEQGVALLQRNDFAGAFAKINAAAQLLPGDPKINANWYLARAGLALEGGELTETISNLEEAKALDPNNTAIATALDIARKKREQASGGIQRAFEETRARLAAPAGNVDAGAQLRSVEQHSRRANALQPNKGEAGKAIDTPGENSGTIAYPTQRGREPAFASQLPATARNDDQVKQSLAWYGKLDGLKQDAEAKIADIKEKQRNGRGDSAVLNAQEATLRNQMKQFTDDQAKAKNAIKKRVKDLGFNWDEAAPSNLAGTTPAGTSNSESQAEGAQSKLDFVQ